MRGISGSRGKRAALACILSLCSGISLATDYSVDFSPGYRGYGDRDHFTASDRCLPPYPCRSGRAYRDLGPFPVLAPGYRPGLHGHPYGKPLTPAQRRLLARRHARAHGYRSYGGHWYRSNAGPNAGRYHGRYHGWRPPHGHRRYGYTPYGPYRGYIPYDRRGTGGQRYYTYPGPGYPGSAFRK